MIFVWISTVIVVSVSLLYQLYQKLNKKESVVKIVNDGLTYQSMLQFIFALKKVESSIETEQPTVPESFKMDIQDIVPNKLEIYDMPKDQDYNIEFPVNDEDKKNVPWYISLVNKMLNSLPVKDFHKEFPDEWLKNDKLFEEWENETVSAIYKSFKHTFVDLNQYDIESDKGISLMAFSGLGCHYMQRLNKDDFETDEILKKYKDSHLKSAAFVIDLRVLGQFPVRDGFVKYGCSAYFDSKYQIIGIYLSAYNQLCTPRDQDQARWQHAKWILKVTITTAITIKTHLLETHQIVAQSLVTSTREQLPFDHPLRRFLKPFCFRTIYINYSAATNLIGEKQLVHRAWAYDYKEVNDIMNALQKSFKFELYKDQFKRSGMDEVPNEVFPIKQDMGEYWEITHKFVTNYIKIYYTSDTLTADEFIPKWYAELCAGLQIEGDSPLNTLSVGNLCDILTHCIFNGSAWHQYVGNTIQEYLRRPNWCGSKIRAGNSTKSDIQAYIQAITIGLLTGLPMPNVLQPRENYIDETEWKFVLLNDEHIEETSAVFDEWHMDLIKMSEAVVARNKTRKMPLWFCDPAKLDVSVGI